MKHRFKSTGERKKNQMTSLGTVKTSIVYFSSRLFTPGVFTVPHAVGEIYYETNSHPHTESHPRHCIEHHHQVNVNENTDRWQKRYEGYRECEFFSRHRLEVYEEQCHGEGDCYNG